MTTQRAILTALLLLVLACTSASAAPPSAPGSSQFPQDTLLATQEALTASAVTDLDWMARDAMVFQRPMGRGQDLGNWIGGVPGHAVLAVAVATSDDKEGMDLTLAMAKGLIVNGLLTEIIKRTVKRQRPDKGACTSWPSGHTSSTVAALTVLDAYWGHDSGREVPLVAVGTLVALSRVQANRHWFSDILAGAVLGHVCGKWAAGEADESTVLATAAGIYLVGMMVKHADTDDEPVEESGLTPQFAPVRDSHTGRLAPGMLLWQTRF